MFEREEGNVGDRKGILDGYVYGYDLMGIKTSIEKQRRGLLKESSMRLKFPLLSYA